MQLQLRTQLNKLKQELEVKRHTRPTHCPCLFFQTTETTLAQVRQSAAQQVAQAKEQFLDVKRRLDAKQSELNMQAQTHRSRLESARKETETKLADAERARAEQEVQLRKIRSLAVQYRKKLDVCTCGANSKDGSAGSSPAAPGPAQQQQPQSAPPVRVPVGGPRARAVRPPPAAAQQPPAMLGRAAIAQIRPPAQQQPQQQQQQQVQLVNRLTTENRVSFRCVRTEPGLRLQQLQSKVQSLEARIRTLQTQIAALEKEKAELGQQHEQQLAKLRAEKDAQLALLTQEKDELASTIETSKFRHTLVENTLASKKQQCEELQREVNELRTFKRTALAIDRRVDELTQSEEDGEASASQ